MKSTGENPGAEAKKTRVRTDSVRTLELPEWDKVGDYAYSCETIYPTVFPERFDSILLGTDHVDSSRLVFFDTETTGLSSGAGTIGFLIGVGRIEDGRFVLRQHFLSDFPGEREYLQIILEQFPSGSILVSYNGASFDLPLLRTRFAMNGSQFPDYEHLDLLHHARRLWQRRIGSCTLSNVEDHILEMPRHDDVPGYEIPDIYFGFLKSGDSQTLEPVFEHHRRDIVSLHILLSRCEYDITNGGPDEIDVRRTGNWLYRSDPDRAMEMIRAGYVAGEVSSGLALALMHRRRKEIDMAVEIWRRLWHEMTIPAAGIELAKYYEHRVKRRVPALEIVESLLLDARTLKTSVSSQLSRVALSRRKERLTQRIENQPDR